MTADLRQRAEALRQRTAPHAAATPPEERGRRLATFPRGKEGREGLRVTWDEYEGHPYLSLRIWTRDDSGGWWPDKHRGVTVRLRELPDLATAIADALDLAEQALPPSRSTHA